MDPEQQELCWDGDDDCSEQEENLARVSARLSGAVLDFCQKIIRERPDNPVFHMEELRTYVVDRNLGPIAPDSPGRILRLLKGQRAIYYKVINRRESVYLLIEPPQVLEVEIDESSALSQV